jgi:hypothetical protein
MRYVMEWTNQIIQRPGFCVRGQPGALDVALDQATLLQHSPHALGDPLYQGLQLRARRRRNVAEYGHMLAINQIYAVDTDHVEVHVQVQR